jgi:tRNA 2-thiouridine synthesizing protein A
MSNYSLDARRLLCPMPVIRTQHKIEKLTQGDILEVICTDPGVINDIPAWCRINGHHVLKISEVNSDIVLMIGVGQNQNKGTCTFQR